MNDSLTRFSIGIDLGTTHCALAVRKNAAKPAELLPIPQFVEIGQVGVRTLLPSFGLQPDETSRDKLSSGLPWGAQHGLVVGEFARTQAYKQPGRVITSSKSWLSHADVDRTENILPWEADEGVAQCSPVIAASMYLSQLRRAFEHAYPEAGKLSQHDVVLTVPASFDPVARELTLRAAELAGIGTPRLLEEPQSALYSWLDERGKQWREELSAGDLVLVCDVGGGTTDFSLISIVDNDGNLELERIAVGDHILLGGDNMDLTLAFVVRQKLQREQGISLDRWQFKALTQACRVGKETLFGDATLDSTPIVIPSRGSKLIGGSIRTELSRETLTQILVDGFFPKAKWAEELHTSSRSALSEVGLPYATDPAITRHLAHFLRRHSGSEGARRHPTAVLFNGGVFKASAIQDRVCQALNDWAEEYQQGPVRRLSSVNLDASVALGAAHFADVALGGGIRIRGGVAHAYYVGIEEAMPAIPGFDPPINAVCLVPAGTEEGSLLELGDHSFNLRLGETADFRLFSSSVRKDDTVGSSFDLWSDQTLTELPTVQAQLPATGTSEIVRVKLEVLVTEVGTIQLFCVSLDDPTKRWGLEFNIRSNELLDA